MEEYSVVGKRTPKAEALPKATGEAKFAVDVTLPGMLYGKILTSRYAHARILNIDTTKARRLPGVKAVITAADIPDRRKLPVIGPPIPSDQGILARDEVRYLGEALAAVAAVDEETSEEALDLIEVEYEVLPAIFDPEEAMRPGAIKIHEHAENNIPVTNYHEYGDVEKGFKESDYVREDTFKVHRIAYMHPEPQVALASFDPVSGKLTVWASTQVVTVLRKGLANLLDIPWTKIAVKAPYVGGGYGGKTSVFPCHFCAAALSIKIGRPVKIANTRQEEFALEWSSRHAVVITIKTGVKKDGTLVAREGTGIWDVGAYKIGIAGPTPQAYIGVLHMPYRIPNVKLKGIAVYTNKQPIGPYRGYGQYPALWSADIQMELIARDLGIDPLEMRLKNLVQPHSETPLGWTINTCGLPECLGAVGKAIDWEEERRTLAPGLGKGTSTSWFSNPGGMGTPQTPLPALVAVNADGTAHLMLVGSDSGSGQTASLRMMVAEELGIGLEDVTAMAPDSDLFSHEDVPFAVTISAYGRPVRTAAIKAREMILEPVADKLEANVADLESRNGRVCVKGSPEKGMPFAEAARLAIARKGPILCRGDSFSAHYERHGAQWVADRFMRFSHPGLAEGFAFGAAAAEVEVDQETGRVRVLRAAHAYDVGFAVNPLSVEGQLQGGAAMSIGGLTTEEVLYDGGQILNSSYLNYKMLTALDVPDVIPIIVEEGDPNDGPYGAKELGMGALIATGSAVVNAIFSATGVMIKELPATPERILKALEGKD